jgi:Protein of unknown function (DUF1559)
MPRVRFSVRRLMLAVAIVAGFLAIAAANRSRWRALERWGMEQECYSSLNNIALALHSYSEEFGRVPRPYETDAHGRKQHSWRPVLLRWFPVHYPQSDHYDLGLPWDGPANRPFSSEVPGFLSCPSERRDNHHGSPFVMINDFGDTPIDRIPMNAILVLEAWGANRDWLDPNDHFDTVPPLNVMRTDHPHGFGVILRDLSRVRVRDPARIRKVGKYYVLDR